MDRAELQAFQGPLKERYRAKPASALVTEEQIETLLRLPTATASSSRR